MSISLTADFFTFLIKPKVTQFSLQISYPVQPYAICDSQRETIGDKSDCLEHSLK